MKQMKQMKQYIIGMLFVLFLCPVSVYANDSEGVISSTSETQSSAIVNTENVLNEIPEDVIPIKFKTREQADQFFSLMDKEFERGKTFDYDKYSYLLNEQENYFDLSNVEITEEMFIETLSQTELVSNNTRESMTLGDDNLISLYSFSDYPDQQTESCMFNHVEPYAFGKINVDVSATIRYMSKKFVSCDDFNASFTGLHVGLSWETTSYAANISDNGYELTIDFTGIVHRYILINSSLTEIDSYKRSASIEFSTYDRIEGWRKIGGTEYYIDSDGDMLTGWHTLDWSGGRNEFYFNSEGEMLKGWHTLDWSGGRNEFYFDSDGCMVTGWHTLNWSGGRNEFYFDSDGCMVTGWHTLNWSGGRNEFYFDSDGCMVTGWHTLDWSGGRNEFYFDSDGCMVTGWHTLYRNGVMCSCYFDSDGALRIVEPYDDSFD